MNFLKALSIFLGTVIGVGIFALPFVTSKAGFFIVLFYFIVMTLVVISINLIFGEVISGSKGLHRLPGYVGEYLGGKWKKISFLIIIVGLTGALLAYLIIGGQFLSLFLSSYFGGTPVFYTLLFFALGAYLIFRDIKSISQVEVSLLFVFLIILFLFFIKAIPHIEISYLKTLNLKFLSLPYGVILFSLWGSAVIPEIKEMLADRTNLRKVIIWGIVLTTFIYLFFIFIVLGVSGNNTSEEAFSGLEQSLGGNIIKLGFIFGVITCFTSFLTLALTLKKTLWYDFGLSKNLAWFLTCFLPLAFFILGLREFIKIISFTGAIALGLEGIIIIFLYQAFLRKRFSRKMNPFFYPLILIFILGIIFETIYFLC